MMKWLIVIGCCSACAAAVPAPNERLAQAIDLERDAWGLGAEDDPHARVAVRRANGEIDQAMDLMRAGKNAQASDLLMRAHVDAELALQLSREAIMRKRAGHAHTAWLATRER